MLPNQVVERIRKMAEEVSSREGCRLYDLELAGSGRQRTLRVTIEGQEKPVSIEQCADVSRGLSLLLDVEDLVGGGAYQLEVSSPGVDRPLRELWHFSSAVGETVRLHTSEGFVHPEEPEGRPRQAFEGELVKVEGDQVHLRDRRGRDWVLPYQSIQKGRVVFSDGPVDRGAKKVSSSAGGKGKTKKKR